MKIFKKQFTTSSIKNSITEFVAVPTVIVYHIGRDAIYGTILALITMGIYLSSPYAVTLENEFISLAEDYLSSIHRVMHTIRDMPNPVNNEAEMLIARDMLNFTRGIISSFTIIVAHLNGLLESTNTMSPQYDTLFNLARGFEILEPTLRLMYRNFEQLLNIPIDMTELVPETYESVFNDYVYALGGDPDTAAEAMGESPVSSGSPSSDDMDID